MAPHVMLYDLYTYKPPAECKADQEQIARMWRSTGRYDEGDIAFMERVFANSGLSPTETHLPPTLNPRFVGSRARTDLEAAREECSMAVCGAVEGLLNKTGLRPKDIDILVTTCSVFCPTPSMASMLVNKFGMRSDVQSYHLGGMGCANGVVGINLVADLLKAHPNSTAVFVTTETLSANYYAGRDRHRLLGLLLFRMGGAAVCLTNKPGLRARAKYELLHRVRVHMGQSDDAFRAIRHCEDSEGLLGVYLGKNVCKEASKAMQLAMIEIAPRILTWRQLFAVAVDIAQRRARKLLAPKAAKHKAPAPAPTAVAPVAAAAADAAAAAVAAVAPSQMQTVAIEAAAADGLDTGDGSGGGGGAGAGGGDGKGDRGPQQQHQPRHKQQHRKSGGGAHQDEDASDTCLSGRADSVSSSSSSSVSSNGGDGDSDGVDIDSGGGHAVKAACGVGELPLPATGSVTPACPPTPPPTAGAAARERGICCLDPGVGTGSTTISGAGAGGGAGAASTPAPVPPAAPAGPTNPTPRTAGNAASGGGSAGGTAGSTSSSDHSSGRGSAGAAPYRPSLQESTIRHFILHAGGAKVLDGLGEALQLDASRLGPSRDTLWDYGNVSSSTTWYALAHVETVGGVRRGERVLQVGVGSGIKCGVNVWKALRDIHEVHDAWAHRANPPAAAAATASAKVAVAATAAATAVGVPAGAEPLQKCRTSASARGRGGGFWAWLAAGPRSPSPSSSSPLPSSSSSSSSAAAAASASGDAVLAECCGMDPVALQALVAVVAVAAVAAALMLHALLPAL
ncbi:hypothetical protein CHLRE_07g319600v5 [Chlamydomonas reinhardtii]|uniref:very-long-chain 3-oxoacyl-CoA synthase n=1 Tax=Chlamydomonas reinhardtii TaxID=3055 RepID=A0A2K3DIY4_CHLRE|nr:uncharacterized protein CHLRE_07g319600v5 [Chlamydomonas reinhardtii]PNW80493.1 hypothetical protein CHLRE_07g319600v5 [Chlamydomonas reinhardtii]